MKTHPESLSIPPLTRENRMFKDERYRDSADVEFVPATAYIELKTRLEKAEYSANGFESLYDAAHEENESLKAQLQTQTENMRALEKERDELKLRISEAVAALNGADEESMHEDTWASVMVAIDTLEGKYANRP